MGHRSSFLIKLSFGIGNPPPIYRMQCICVGEGSRVPNLQTEFNYLNLFKSYGIFSDFVVPTWSLSSPSSPRHPRHPHIIPVIPTLSPHCLHSLQKVPMWSPWLWSPWSPPMLSPSSLSFPHCPCHPHVISIIPTLSRRSSDHSQPPGQPLHPPPPPGGGGPKSLKMQ